MNKRIVSFLTFLAMAMNVLAGGTLTVRDVKLMQRGVAEASIEIDNPELQFKGFQFRVALPQGITPVLDDKGSPISRNADRLADHFTASGYADGVASFLAVSLTNGIVKGTSGEVMRIRLSDTASLPVGTKLTATAYDIRLSQEVAEGDGVVNRDVVLPDVTFTITIVDSATGIDEATSSSPATPLYDLYGRKVDSKRQQKKGVFVKEGRKVVVK